MRRHLAALGGALAWLAAGAASAQPTAEPRALGLGPGAPLMRWDPQVRYGQLSNGLRYAVERVAAPKGAVSLRLAFAAGSYDEADDESGAAHIVEHMAFEATRSFGENQAALTFAPMRMAFGPDRNAVSDLGQTVYQIDLPAPDPKALAAAERWLRDVADGLLFAEPGIGRQRAMMKAEGAGRSGALAQLRERIGRFEDGDLRSAARPILGDPARLASVTPARLQAFYARWYRPENAVVVMTGDLPIEALERDVKATFGDWSGRGAPGVRVTAAAPANDGLQVMAQMAPGVSPVVRLCRVAGSDRTDATPPERLRTLLLREVWRAILQRRLNVLGTRADAPFTQTNVSTDVRPDSLKTCVAIAVAKGGELRAIGLVQTELQRLAAEGPTEEETDMALNQLRAIIRGAVGATPQAPAQASEIAQRALENMPQLGPREGLRAFDVLLEDLTPTVVTAQFGRDWSGRGPTVTVVGPDALAEPAIRVAMAVVVPGTPARAQAPAPSAPRPTSPERLAALAHGEQFLRSGQPKDARRVFEELLRRDPRDVDALAGRGRVFAAEGKADPALRDFAAALALQPGSAVALNARGNLYVAINRPEQAIADFNQALAANPQDDVVLYNRGLAYKQMGRQDRALADFDAVLRLTPGDPLTLLGKADAYRQLGDLLLAREFYDAALAADPKNALALQARGEVLEALGDAEGASRDKAQAKGLDPSVGSP